VAEIDFPFRPFGLVSGGLFPSLFPFPSFFLLDLLRLIIRTTKSAVRLDQPLGLLLTTLPILAFCVCSSSRTERKGRFPPLHFGCTAAFLTFHFFISAKLPSRMRDGFSSLPHPYKTRPLASDPQYDGSFPPPILAQVLSGKYSFSVPSYATRPSICFSRRDKTSAVLENRVLHLSFSPPAP